MFISNELSLQDSYLTILCKTKIPVAIYLRNGIGLKGVISSFDDHTVFLQESTDQIIRKKSIATILPVK